MVNKGGVVGGLWCFESKNLEGWWGQDFERSFFKDVTKGFDLGVIPKKN